MKHKFKSLLLTALVGAAALLPARAADFQGQQQAWSNPPGIPLTIAAGTTSNLSVAIPVLAGKPLGLAWNYSGASNVTLTFHPSVDGTNILTNTTWTLTQTNLPLNFTNAAGAAFATIGTNWSAAFLDGYAAVFITGMGNLGSIPITNYAQYLTNSLPSPTNAPSTNGIIINQPYF